MAAKGKSKLENYKIKFNDKTIDLKRFAYDIIVYSAVRFGVPENCICEWEGSVNNYTYPDLCLVIFRSMFRCQVVHRDKTYLCFDTRYKSNKLQSNESVCNLYRDVFQEVKIPERDIFTTLEASLGIACELVIFLYSKGLTLYVKELANHWFKNHFRNKKKEFEKFGGFEIWYERRRVEQSKELNAFCDEFINTHCLDYEKSAKDNLIEIFTSKSQKFFEEYNKKRSSKPGVDSSYVTCEEISFQIPVHLLASKLDEVSLSDLPVDSRLGIIPHEKLLEKDLPSIAGATSQNEPEASFKKPQRDSKRQSYQERRRQRQSRTCSSLDKNLTQLSSDTSGSKQLSRNRPSDLVADDETSLQNIPSTRTSGQQKGKSSTCSSRVQGRTP